MTTAPSVKPSLRLGLLTGVVGAGFVIGADLMGIFYCVNAWLIGTVVVTLGLGVFGAPRRLVAIGSAALVAYLVIIPYIIIHAVWRGRWDASEDMPMFCLVFFLLVILPVCFGSVLDSILRARQAHNAV